MRLAVIVIFRDAAGRFHFSIPETHRGGAAMSCRYFNAKYMMIAEIIARRLRAGDFPADGQFYSRDELAREYHISPGTARSVLRVLEDRGVIACRKGKRAVQACITGEQAAASVLRPVFCRDSCTAETPEYDFLAYCARNLLLRRKSELRERNTDFMDPAGQPGCFGDDVAVFFPSSAVKTGPDPATLPHRPAGGRIDLLIDQAGSNAVSIFTKKAMFDCILHLIRHGASEVIRVASPRSAFPWFEQIAAPGGLGECSPECRTSTKVFHAELELFPDFLTETVLPGTASGYRAVAVLIDDPYLSDYLSDEIRTGAYRPPLRCGFFGTAFNERSMAFPYLDLKLDALAAAILQAAGEKTENPSAALACMFHLIQFRVPGGGIGI